LIGYDYGYGGSELRALFAPSVMTPIYAPMSLVDDTIGTTIFNGQTRYYVELDNGAFFYPGMPTLLNGLDATYDGFRPASHGGILTQAQYNHLENMIYHYRDDNTLGLFFFGYVPQPLQLGFAQEDVYRLFGAFAPRTPSGGLVITGLPSVGGFPAGGGAPNFANIAPAAGEDEEDQTAQGLGEIEPAAGETSDAPCWGDATGMLGQGTAVSYSFGDEGSKLLDKAAACGGQNF
ncbi:MAG TPA: hemagglutinin, partial [Alphaproteobacteria bacterium]|nr:hemagglutinin [Alphaproteobacteria bacterium]